MSSRSLISALIAFVFTLSSVLPSQAFAASQPAKTEVILIQDAHSDEASQLGIEKLLQEITTREKIDFIALEGAWTRLTPEVLEFSGDADTNRKILLHLLKHGEISGADLFAVSHKSKFAFEGVEDKKIYKKYFDILKNILGQHEKAESFSKSLRRRLMDKSSRELNSRLRDFIRQQEQYMEGSLSPLAYLEILKKLYYEEFGSKLTALQNQMDYPNTLRVLALKKQSVSKKAGAEYKKFRASAGPGNLRGIVEAIWDKRGSFPFSENLKSALRFHILEEELAGTGFFTEIDAISEKLLGKLVRAEKEKNSLQEWKNTRLLSKLLKLEISPEDWAAIKEKSFYHPEIDSLYQQVLTFYSGAELRDHVMTENLIRLIHSRRVKKVVLITGGFHTAAIQKLLRSSGIQTRVMTPQREAKEAEGFSQLAGKISLAQYRDSILHTSIALPQIATMAKPNAAQPVAELLDVDSAGVRAIRYRVREAMSAGKSLGTKSKPSLRAKKPVIDIEDLESLPLFRIKEGQRETEQFRVHQHTELNNNLAQLASLLNPGETAEGIYMIYYGRQGEKFKKYEIGFFLKTSKFPNGTALSIVHERKKDGVVLVRGTLYAKGAATNRVYSPLTKTKEMLNEKILEEKVRIEMAKAKIGKKLGTKTNGRSLGETVLPRVITNADEVAALAREFHLTDEEENIYTMPLHVWNFELIAKQRRTEADLRASFAAQQKIRELAKETRFVVGDGFGYPTLDGLIFWSNLLKAGSKTLEELREEFTLRAALQSNSFGSSLGKAEVQAITAQLFTSPMTTIWNISKERAAGKPFENTARIGSFIEIFFKNTGIPGIEVKIDYAFQTNTRKDTFTITTQRDATMQNIATAFFFFANSPDSEGIPVEAKTTTLRWLAGKSLGAEPRAEAVTWKNLPEIIMKRYGLKTEIFHTFFTHDEQLKKRPFAIIITPEERRVHIDVFDQSPAETLAALEAELKRMRAEKNAPSPLTNESGSKSDSIISTLFTNPDQQISAFSLGAARETAAQVSGGLIDPRIVANSPEAARVLIEELEKSIASEPGIKHLSSKNPLAMTYKILMRIVKTPESRPVLNIFTSDQLTEDTVNLVRYLHEINPQERTVIAATTAIPEKMAAKLAAIKNAAILKPGQIGSRIEMFKKEFSAEDVHKYITVTAPKIILDSLSNHSGVNFITPIAENAAFKTASTRERIGALLAERSAAHLLAYHRGDVTAFEKLGLGGILTPASGHTEFAPRYDLNWSAIASSLGKLVDEWRGIEAMRRSA